MRQSHGHGIASASQAHRGRLAAVLAVTSSVLVVEVIGAILSDSLALLADAGHMLTGVAGIGVALLAIWFAARPATPERTFGYYRLEILAAVVNAVLLFGVAGFVLVEAWQRLRDPPEVASGLMLAMAAVGLATNGWLLRDAVDVLLEATPKGVDLAEMRRHLVETPGVVDVHDLHAWTITSGLPVVSVHVVLAENTDSGQVLDQLSACVAGHFDVEHSTFQLEQDTHQEHEGQMHT